jgi:acyl-coenzyme A thioesterase PaaI-like protein
MDTLKARLQNTAFLRLFTFWKIPLIWWIQPSVVEMGTSRTVIKVPLNRRTKNHLRSMYFGAIAIGAELVVAMKAVYAIHQSKRKVDFVFKDFKIDFLKRAEGDVHFICESGLEVTQLVEKTIQTGERETQTFQGYAIVPSKDPNEKVVTFEVTLSVKLRKPKS